MLRNKIAAAEELMARAREGYTPELFEAMQKCIALLIADAERLQDGGARLEGDRKQPSDPIHPEHRVNPEPRDSMDELKDVQRLLGSISSSLTLEDVLHSLMNLSKSVIDYKGCGVFLVNEDTAGLDTAASRTFSKGFEAKVWSQWDEGIIDWVMDVEVERARLERSPIDLVLMKPFEMARVRDTIGQAIALRDERVQSG